MSAEAMNSEEVQHPQEASTTKNHDGDNIQEDIFQDIFESAVEVRKFFFCQIIKVVFYFSCFIIMSESACECSDFTE